MTADSTIQLDKRAEAVRLGLERAGYASYHVGGSVRDLLMAKEPKDWDITTTALPGQVTELFGEGAVLPTGLKYGTVTVFADGLPVQVTTFRSDGSYSNHRHADSVEFETDITGDLARRDLTINAIAYAPPAGYIDPFDGRADIDNKVIRSVGNATERLHEDGLRIMRALRFAAVLGFALDPQLVCALHQERQILKFIASERIMPEFYKLLLGDNAEHILKEFPDVISVFIPEVAPTVGFEQHSSYHDLDVWGHTVKAVTLAPKDAIVRLTLLMHDLAKPACFRFNDEGFGTTKGHDYEGSLIATRRLEALHVDGKTVELVSKLIQWHGAKIEEAKPRRWLNRLGEQDLRRFIAVKRADIGAHSLFNRDDRLQKLDAFVLELDQTIADDECFSLRQLAIDGTDVLNAGVAEGPAVGAALHQLLEAVIEGEVANTRSDLLAILESRDPLNLPHLPQRQG